LLAALQSRTRTLIQLHAILDAGILHGGTHGISKNNMENAAKIFSANTVARGGFNVFSQNPWYLSRLMATCEEFTLAELLTFQSLFFSAFLKIAVNYQDQATALKELAIRCLCDHSSR
jgi:DNA polymerase-3 subunit delta